MFYAGKRQATEAYLGTKKVLKMMLGDTKVWATTYAVTTTFTDVTSNAPANVEEDKPLIVTLTPDDGMVIGTVTVLMGGVDITSTAYSNGVVSIASVTDHVVITAIAVIDFADPAVKALCVANWGGNVVAGEITKGEAAAVTSLGGVFRANTQITSFDELRFFTGLTGFGIDSSGKGEFYNCTNLVSVVLPQATVGGTYPAALFYYCTKLAQVDLSPVKSNAYTIYNALRLNSSGGTALIKAILPSGTYSGSAVYAFYRQKGITTIEIKGTADWSGITSYNNAFNQCNALTVITGTITGISQDISFQYSTLDVASATMIVNGLSSSVSGKTLTLKASMQTTYEANAEFVAAVAAKSNWTITYA